MGRDQGDVLAVLGARLQEALARAREAVEESQVLIAASSLARSPGSMAKRCAWCGRLELGLGWRPPEQAPRFLVATLERRATHTICPDCVRRLEESGQSARRASSVNGEQSGDPEPEDDDREP